MSVNESVRYVFSSRPYSSDLIKNYLRNFGENFVDAFLAELRNGEFIDNQRFNSLIEDIFGFYKSRDPKTSNSISRKLRSVEKLLNLD